MGVVALSYWLAHFILEARAISDKEYTSPVLNAPRENNALYGTDGFQEI